MDWNKFHDYAGKAGGLLGAIIGAAVGFQSAGIGGAIVGAGVGGFLLFFVCFTIFSEEIVSCTLFLLVVCGALGGLMLIISLLWNVGKP